MLSQEIRKKFLAYFKDKGHALVPSSPTVPHDDPTLLFINAGMNQFKDVFLGKSQRDYNRATSSQKCIRVGGKHNDLDNVGHTTRHMTFFEMLGNFSFGNYFKKEAIAYAWEVSTQIFKFDPARIWVSVFETDDEAYELWKPYIDEKRIIRLGEDENFWSMGETGPCGPCTELLYDRGEKFGSALSPLEDKTGERYPEFWNLVFMQFNRDSQGNLTPLPKPCVDTGAGLERVVAFMMEAPHIFYSDILGALIARVEELSGKKYDPNDPHLAPAFHVIADHIRALAFAIADGAQPSNVDRGYVLRKILRRAVRYGRLLGFQAPFLADVFPRLLEMMGGDFHELKSAETQICEILTSEEESFFRTLKRGGNILNTIIEKAEQSARKEISGEDAFKLKDTYGFPLE
ncbi:MAG: alanine--tRNA ligase, partial [Chlamydiia bacterium]|nr:alanine--tRNA ligase [Chlamydiia bacterium]